MNPRCLLAGLAYFVALSGHAAPPTLPGGEAAMERIGMIASDEIAGAVAVVVTRNLRPWRDLGNTGVGGSGEARRLHPHGAAVELPEQRRERSSTHLPAGRRGGAEVAADGRGRITSVVEWPPPGGWGASPVGPIRLVPSAATERRTSRTGVATRVPGTGHSSSLLNAALDP